MFIRHYTLLQIQSLVHSLDVATVPQMFACGTRVCSTIRGLLTAPCGGMGQEGFSLGRDGPAGGWVLGKLRKGAYFLSLERGPQILFIMISKTNLVLINKLKMAVPDF